MIILDTNVLSALISDPPNEVALEWAESQPAGVFWTTAITIFEVRLGILNLADGRKRRALEGAFERAVETDLDRRVLPFDDGAAAVAANISAMRKQAGRPVDVRDIMIAGIARDRAAPLATRNIRHFEGFGVKTINPWQSN